MTAQEMTGKVKIVGGGALAIAAVWVCALILTSHAFRKTDETVVVDQNHHGAVLTPAINPAPLPYTDSDLEIVGDQIAKAIIHLNRKQRDKALLALDQAQTASRRALANRSNTDPSNTDPKTVKINERLRLALRETEQARQQIARGKSSAAVLALRKLAHQLDAV
ncbi:MAG: hypothetical protein J2P21_15445 [Chloracidobacterium sp.]|nr:hypothetical protein [Chloracidobacterium sp.]